MKKEKLLVKEINVLSEVIKDKVNGERKRMLDERVSKCKEYVDLEKRIKKFNEDVEKMKKIEEGFKEEVGKIEKKLGLGNDYGGKEKIGYLSWNSMISSYGNNSGFKVNLVVNSFYSSDVYNRLMVENIDGELKVSDLIERMVKEFVGK